MVVDPLWQSRSYAGRCTPARQGVTESAVVSGAPPLRPTPSRLTLVLIVTPLVALTIAAYLGDAFMPYLVDNNPLLLITLNARNRNLALVTNQLDAVSYYVVGTVRLLISDPLFYLLGWFYGDAAVRWAERNTNTLGDMLRWVEKHFRRWGVPLVFVMPNNFICLFAGASAMRPAIFVVANVSGTIARLYVIRVLGETFSQPLDWLVDFIGRYRGPLLVLSFALVAFTIFNERKRGGGELTGLAHLPDHMDDRAGDTGDAGTTADRRDSDD
jgi:membrane protein DedA with SNARE-associated domain